MPSRLVLLLVLVGGAVRAQVPTELAGTWAGALVQDGTPRLFTLEIEAHGDSLATTLVLPYRGYDSFPAAVAYEPPAPGETGDGHLTSDLFGGMRLLVDLGDRTLRGTVSRPDGAEATAFLQRVLPYGPPRVREEPFTVVSGRDTLAGALVLPAEPEYGGGPHPAVVLVTGRGYGSRWQTRWLALLFARAGVAGVVWDGRGTGGSTGDRSTVTSAQRVADVDAVLDWALRQPAVDATQVGALGLSAGAWIAPLAVADRDDVAFLITLAGPTEPLDAQQGHVTARLMRDSDSTYTDAEYRAAFVYQRDLVRLAQRGAAWPEYEALNAPARAARWAEHALIPDSLGLPDLSYYARMPGLDPIPALSTWRRPLLAVFGARDWIVPPEEQAPLLRRWAWAAGNDDVTIAVLDMDHGGYRPEGEVGEGAWPRRYRRDRTRAPELYDTLLGWLDDHTTTAPERDGP